MAIPPEAEQLFDDAGGDVALGELEAARAKFGRCVELAPDYFEAWHALGMTLLKTGHAAEAIAAGRRAVELRPGDQLAWSSLSLAYVRAGMIPDAEAAAAKARMLGWGAQLQAEQ